MKYILEKELADGLKTLGLKEGDTVMVHSSLFSLGLIRGIPPAEQAKAYLKILQHSVGDEGTLLAPAFNFDFCNGKPFHRQNSPSVGMGILSETIRTHKNACRSKHPMQSVAVLGRKSEWITGPDTNSSFSIGGAIHRFIESNGKLLLLGSSIMAAALIHWAEERLEVPYRYWKSFHGDYIDDKENISEVRTYQMYARDLKLNPILDLKPLENALKELGLMDELSLGMGTVKVIESAAFIQTAQKLLEEDPYSLLENAEEIRGLI
ncbi:MAG: aminoglycoside N(3)-acetyltransferase [Balneolaceae bacterium]|nr:MAG: aminoglycoside N(3)-acetyltransferase [Balneolaceae bacterium]